MQYDLDVDVLVLLIKDVGSCCLGNELDACHL